MTHSYHRPMRRALRNGGFVLLIVVAFAAGWVPLPYFALGPGPSSRGRSADPRGRRPDLRIVGSSRDDDDPVHASDRAGGDGRVDRPRAGGRGRGDRVSTGALAVGGGAAGDLADGPEQDRRGRGRSLRGHELSPGSRAGRPGGVRWAPTARRTVNCSRETRSCGSTASGWIRRARHRGSSTRVPVDEPIEFRVEADGRACTTSG